MSSIQIAFAAAAVAAVLGHAEVSCPATARLSEKIEQPAGWVSQPSTRQATFLRVSILNGKPGGEEYDLAPSSTVQRKGGNFTQVWRLEDYRDMNLFLRCRYRNTDAVLNIDLPRALQTCTFRFRLDPKGEFLGQSFVTCK